VTDGEWAGAGWSRDRTCRRRGPATEVVLASCRRLVGVLSWAGPMYYIVRKSVLSRCGRVRVGV